MKPITVTPVKLGWRKLGKNNFDEMRSTTKKRKKVFFFTHFVNMDYRIREHESYTM